MLTKELIMLQEMMNDPVLFVPLSGQAMIKIDGCEREAQNRPQKRGKEKATAGGLAYFLRVSKTGGMTSLSTFHPQITSIQPDIASVTDDNNIRREPTQMLMSTDLDA